MISRAFLIASALAATALSGTAGAQTTDQAGIFESDQDIGDTAFKGAVVHDPMTGTYRLTSSGANIWADKDAFHYAWARRSGDIHIAADVGFVGAGSDPHRKAGLMIRQNLTPGSPYADVMLHGNGEVCLQYRSEQGGQTFEIISAVKDPRRIQLEREGDFVYFSVAGADGVLHHAGGSFRMAFQAPYYVGLALSAHNNTLTEQATFANVELKVPSLAYVPDTGYAAKVESTLEVIDVGGTQPRRVVRQFDGKIEAPNWTRDGKELVYNSNGRLWRVPVEGGAPVAIDTGPNVHSNNDHGISPDGRLLIMSDQSEPDNLSRILLLPLAGTDKPRMVVSDPKARSYWHGWSPDGGTIAYVRVSAVDDSYDIYTHDLVSGKEQPLVVGPGADDGPEWAPDGSALYFNSTRSGTMHLYRAKPDGSDPHQITSDDHFDDWFAHLSPDGKWIAFISFDALDVVPADHPPNRTNVMLRLMPADGSAPPVLLTRLFGGQGTINVPSWSPDSKQIAFVSYRLVR